MSNITRATVTGRGAITFTGELYINDGAQCEGETDTAVTPERGLALEVNKAVDKAYAYPGDTLTYTVTVTNTGGVTARSISLHDVVTERFNVGSVTIDGASYPLLDPTVGFILPDIPARGSLEVTYEVTVIGPGTVYNQASVTSGTVTERSNVVSTLVLPHRRCHCPKVIVMSMYDCDDII